MFTIGIKNSKIHQPDLSVSCNRFTYCANENHMSAIIAAKPISKPKPKPPPELPAIPNRVISRLV